MRLAFGFLLLAVVTIIMIPVLQRSDLLGDEGSRDYAFVSDLLAGIPGVVVHSGWHHDDVTVDRFGLDHSTLVTCRFELSFTGRVVNLSLDHGRWFRTVDPGSAVIILRRHIREQIDRDLAASGSRLTNRSSERP